MKLKLNKENQKKIAKGFGIAMAGVVLAFLVELVPTLELGHWGPLVGGMLAVLVNTVRQLKKDN